MEREIIYCLSWDLTISGPDRQTIAPELASMKKPLHFPYGFSPHPLLSTLISPLRAIPYRRTLHIPKKTVSPYPNSSSSSSRKSSPPSPGPKTPPNKDSSVLSTTGGKPVHIDFIGACVSWLGRVRREMQGGFGRRRVRYRIRKVKWGAVNVKMTE